MRQTIRITLSFVAALFLLSKGWAVAEGGSLDGKSFAGTFTEKGKAKGDADTLVFKDGKFRSTACDAYGFSEASYKAAAKDGATSFEVTTESPKEGTMKWKGTVRGGRIEGTAVWMKKGQADINYTFHGELKK
jgi:hypothetical protein